MSISTYKTPGVYIKEISTLPPSVAEVATAVPAFIGYTEIGPTDGAKTVIKRIASMLEFETAFGGPKPSRFTVHVPIDVSGNPTGSPVVTQPIPGEGFALYYALTHYFKNGGGPCYIVSVGSYASTATAKESFSTGLKALERMDEPTLIVLTDAACLLSEPKYYELCGEALEQCKKLGNRFTIIDVPSGATQDGFRTGLQSDYLMYGAAYYPYLQTSICCDYEESKVGVRSRVKGELPLGEAAKGLKVTYSGPSISTPTVAVTVTESASTTFKVEGRLLSIRAEKGATASKVFDAWQRWGKRAGFDISKTGTGNENIAALENPEFLVTEPKVERSLELGGDNGLKVTFTGVSGSSPAVTVKQSSTPTFTVDGNLLTIGAAKGATAKVVVDAWSSSSDHKGDFSITQTLNGTGTIAAQDKVQLVVSVAVSRVLAGQGLRVTFSGPADSSPAVRVEQAGTETPTFTVNGNLLAIHAATNAKAEKVAAAWKAWDGKPAGFDIAQTGDGSAAISPTGWTGIPVITTDDTLESQKRSATAVYNRVRAALAEQYIVLPPSAAMAGIYARVDRDQGVWKSPANVSVMAVLGATTKITDHEQENLNIDPTAGKSINAIRDFTGKGTLVWGGRTLAGNSNEWRYISVRRLFITIEESCKKASAFAVFEPNDQTTWLKVKAMVESYLYGLWEQGALAGSKPEAAYFVHVGLNITMKAADALAGRMIVKIGVAAVRPAEFVVLEFSHKMQSA